MFQLLPCSRCQRTFTVRGETSDAALLKCPNCGNQFRLGELLDAYYAPWQVIEDPAAGQSIGDFNRPPNALAKTAARMESGSSSDLDILNSAEFSHEHSGGLSLDGIQHNEVELKLQQDSAATIEAIESGPVDWSKFKPITYEEFERIKRRSRSGVWSTIQIFLGGAAAIPVTLLLLWYALDQDPAGAGPTVARYVPWIVPQKFRGNQPGFNPPADSLSKVQNSPRNSDDAPPNSPLEFGAKPQASEPSTALVVGALKDDGTATQGRQPDGSLASLHKPVDLHNSVESAMGTSSVYGAMKNAKDKIRKWNQLADADIAFKGPFVMGLMNDLSSIGAFLSEPDRSISLRTVRDQSEQICRMIRDQGDLSDWLRQGADAHLRGAARPADGWALICTVGELQEEPQMWRIMVADADLLSHGVPSIEIPKSIAPRIMKGQKLLLLGRLVNPPGTASQNSGKPAPMPALFLASFSHSL